MSARSIKDEWGNDANWRRAFFARSNLLWLLRDEMARIELDQLRWLEPLVAETLLLADRQAGSCATDEGLLRILLSHIETRLEHQLLANDSDVVRLRSIARDGAPCDVIGTIFDQLAMRSGQIYRLYVDRKVVLTPMAIMDHPLREQQPGEYRDSYHVDANTTITGQVATIALKVHLDRFEWPSLLAIPALLTHELICHAFARQVGGDAKSLWAEGVMDWTASYFFEAWSCRLCLPYSLVTWHGDELWRLRPSSARFTGRMAARELIEWLVTDPSVQSSSVAKATAAHLTLAVNSTSAHLAMKDELASRLVNIRKDKDLQDSLRAWRHGDGSATGLLT